tara:strand:+ start:238 stop:456 length:219 start_codon:yes stop_codon:yes gene_type:complete
MKTGDLVRFRREVYPRARRTDCGIWDWQVGLLVEYNTWEKVARILHNGKVHSVHASEVQKAGKKDWERSKYK